MLLLMSSWHCSKLPKNITATRMILVLSGRQEGLKHIHQMLKKHERCAYTNSDLITNRFIQLKKGVKEKGHEYGVLMRASNYIVCTYAIINEFCSNYNCKLTTYCIQ